MSSDQIRQIVYVAIGVVVLVAFVIAARIVPRLFEARLRHLPPTLFAAARRVIAVVLLVVGVLVALSLAVESANVTLAGILLATIVAAFGVQDVLKDYVSGYYVLLERHIRPGDHITMDGAGTGKVLDIKLRVTLLQTDSGDLVVVPNSELFNKAVEVHARAAERVAEAEGAKPEPPK